MLIGLLGNAGSGKDTASEYLVQKHGFYSIALADPIKIYCQWMFGWSAKQLWGPSEERNILDKTIGVSPRVVLQSLGDWAREYKENCYIKAALQRVDAVQYSKLKDDFLFGRLPFDVLRERCSPQVGICGTVCIEHVVISDVRFKNEVEGIKAEGGKIIRLYRPKNNDNVDQDLLKHISETEQQCIDSTLIDYEVKNLGTKTYLYQQLDTIINEINIRI